MNIRFHQWTSTLSTRPWTNRRVWKNTLHIQPRKYRLNA